LAVRKIGVYSISICLRFTLPEEAPRYRLGFVFFGNRIDQKLTIKTIGEGIPGSGFVVDPLLE
jgi:hypothetical protein